MRKFLKHYFFSLFNFNNHSNTEYQLSLKFSMLANKSLNFFLSLSDMYLISSIIALYIKFLSVFGVFNFFKFKIFKNSILIWPR